MDFNKLLSKNRTSIMGCAMIAIMLFHQPFYFSNPFVDFFHLYGAWGVELFLFVSGYGIVHALRKNSLKEFYSHRIIRIIPSCLIVGICKYLLTLFGFNEFIGANFLLTVTNIYLWYIYAIIFYYLISPLLLKLLAKNGILCLLAVCFISYGFTFVPFGNSSNYFINHLGWITNRLPIFLFGMYIALYPLKYKTRHIFSIGMVFFAVCMILQLGATMVRFKWNVPYLNLLLLPATPMLCLLCCQITWVFDKIKMSSLLIFFGTLSLDLYLWHEFIYWNIYRNPFFSNISVSYQCLIAVLFSLTLAFATYLLKESIIKRLSN